MGQKMATARKENGKNVRQRQDCAATARPDEHEEGVGDEVGCVEEAQRCLGLFLDPAVHLGDLYKIYHVMKKEYSET